MTIFRYFFQRHFVTDIFDERFERQLFEDHFGTVLFIVRFTKYVLLQHFAQDSFQC